ncbi:MAG: hypothetical protein U0802_01160 [Candidatus Binatia bacterium]
MGSIRTGSLLVAAWLLLAGVGPAAAERPTCGDLLSARALGQSPEQVASAFGTTRARVEACARAAEHHERLDAQQRHVQTARDQRVAR